MIKGSKGDMRRRRNEFSLKRRRATRKSRSNILIVCEGGETEPTYFDKLCSFWGLPRGLIEIKGKECGSAPISVVDYALKCKKERKDALKKDSELLPYDQIWCVIDHDNHKSLDRAIDKAKAHKFRIALSIPSIEFWYLLHFAYTTKPLADCDSATKELNKVLKKHRVNYLKNDPPTNLLFPRLETGIQHAKRIRKHCECTSATNPSTDVDLLVQELRKLKR